MPRVVSVSAAAGEVSASPATILNDGAASATITVRVFNAEDGEPIAGQAVTLALVSGTGTLTQPAAVTNQAGVATGSVLTSTLGTMVIKATVLGRDITEQASVVASGTAVTDPDDLRSGSYADIVFREFNSKASSDADRGTGSFPSKTGGSEGWDGVEWDDANIEIPTAEAGLTWLSGSAPFGDGSNNVMQTQFPLGFSGSGSAPGTAQTQGLGGSAHLWVQFSIAFQSTYQDGPAGLNKLWFVWPTGASGGTFLGVLNGVFRYNLQGTPDNARGYLTNNVDNAPAIIATDGRWYTVVMEFIATGNSASGEFRMWIADNDSVGKEFEMVAEYTDVNYGQSGFTLLQWRPVWGGVDAGMSVDPEFNYAVDTVKVWGY